VLGCYRRWSRAHHQAPVAHRLWEPWVVFGRLVGEIDGLLARLERVVVGVSGFGGAGKTTLASRLRDHYGLREGQVVRLDSFILDRAGFVRGVRLGAVGRGLAGGSGGEGV
jgi:pantothenate kinase-related protein Tda10